MKSFAGAIILGVLAAFLGRKSGDTDASREALMFLGSCLGAIAGAVIGGSMDIVVAIKENQAGRKS